MPKPWSKSERNPARGAAIAEKLGLVPSDFTMANALLSLPQEWQADVDAGRVGKTTAYYLARLDDPQMRNELWQQARDGQLTKDQARAAVKKRAARSPTAGAGRPDQHEGGLAQPDLPG